MDERGLAYYFARWSKGLTLYDIPDSIHVIAHRAMLDTLGVIVAGGVHPNVRCLTEVWPATTGACGLVTGGKTSAEGAALINGSAAHVWDFDDTSYTGIMHGSAVIFPVVIALAQELDASEEEVRIAFIIGSEIAYVMADICGHQHYFHGWWSTVTFGLIGATAAAARLLGCSEDQTAQAVGLAAAAAGGGKSVFGTSAKPFLVGETAQRAITFARFIAGGLTGPTDAFQGKIGFLHLLNNDTGQLGKAESLGRCWHLADPGLLVKRNPVCSAAQALIEEVARLTFNTGLSPDDIDTLYVEVPTLVRISLIYDVPQTPSEAQFSLPFTAACAALHGAVRLAYLDNRILQSPELQTLMKKVQVSLVDDLSTEEMRKRYPESARVCIVLKDGSKRKGFCGEAYGMPGRPLSDTDFLGKFEECLTFAGCSATVQNITDKSLLHLVARLFGRNPRLIELDIV